MQSITKRIIYNFHKTYSYVYLNIACIHTLSTNINFNYRNINTCKLYNKGYKNKLNTKRKMSETSPLPKYQPPPVAMLKRIKYRNALDRPIVPVPSIDIHVIGCGGTGSPRAVCINTTTTK